MNLHSISPYLDYQQGQLCFDGVNLKDLASQYGTPLYVYSQRQICRAYLNYATACQGLAETTICYAVKANSNIHILKELAQLGAGFDIVSAGELQRVLAAGAPASRAVFAGVGKTSDEIRFAIEAGVGCFNVESAQEMQRIASLAESMQKQVAVSLRVNPDVDAQTHPYISTGLKENKFGVSMEEAIEVYQFAQAQQALKIHGIDCHIGSQLTDASPYGAALERVLALVDTLADCGIFINHLDLGGGIGIRYKDETPPDVPSVLKNLVQKVKVWADVKGRAIPTLSFEPGRSIVGNAGILISEVQYIKSNGEKHFAIIDAAMNDLMRPALYQAYHGVAPVTERNEATTKFDLVGPVCETGDWLAKQRDLTLKQGDLVALLSAGAYGQTMASNYNTRGRAAEILVNQGNAKLIRRRETIEDQLRTEMEI